MHPNAQRVLDEATRLGLSITVKQFPEGTKTAVDAANAIGVEVGQIVKSLIFAVGDPATKAGEIVVALLPGDHQLDERKLAAAARAGGCWRVDADAVREATGFPIGGVAPLAHRQSLRVFADTQLFRFDEVWAAAGTWHDVFGVEPYELVKRIGAIEADLHRSLPSQSLPST
jgi:prolyl-tRNA editing enzyme YbaK/EbsC (Cys-tRNA(Pro) deacylase)